MPITCKVQVLNVCLLNSLVKKNLLPTQELPGNLFHVSKHKMLPTQLLKFETFYFPFQVYFLVFVLDYSFMFIYARYAMAWPLFFLPHIFT